MKPWNTDKSKNVRGAALLRVNRIFSDIHFWVPVVVLVGGLLLLRFIN
jgi:hypothetical protein